MSFWLALQWLLVAAIGLGAVLMLARHYGWGRRKSGGCPGCHACERPATKSETDAARRV